MPEADGASLTPVTPPKAPVTPPKAAQSGPGTRFARSRSHLPRRLAAKAAETGAEQAEEQSEFITVTVPAEELRPVPKKKRKAKSPAPREPVAKEPASEPSSAASGVRERVQALRSAPSVPSQSARLSSVEPSLPLPVPSERAKGKATEVSKKTAVAAASRPASAEKQRQG